MLTLRAVLREWTSIDEARLAYNPCFLLYYQLILVQQKRQVFSSKFVLIKDWKYHQLKFIYIFYNARCLITKTRYVFAHAENSVFFARKRKFSQLPFSGHTFYITIFKYIFMACNYHLSYLHDKLMSFLNHLSQSRAVLQSLQSTTVNKFEMSAASLRLGCGITVFNINTKSNNCVTVLIWLRFYCGWLAVLLMTDQIVSNLLFLCMWHLRVT